MHIQDVVNVLLREPDEVAEPAMRHLAVRHESAQCPLRYADEFRRLFVGVRTGTGQLVPTMDARGSVRSTLVRQWPRQAVTCIMPIGANRKVDDMTNCKCGAKTYEDHLKRARKSAHVYNGPYWQADGAPLTGNNK